MIHFNFDQEIDTIAIGVFSDEFSPQYYQLETTLKKQIYELIGQDLISREAQAITPIFSLGKKAYLVGLGKSAEYDLEQYRKILGKLAKEVKEETLLLLDTFTPHFLSIYESAAIAAETLTLANYQFKEYKAKDSQAKMRLLHLYSDVNIESDIERGLIYGAATNHARDLFNQPGNGLTASDLAKEIASFACEYQLDYQIIEQEEMQERKMGGILGVNRGSTEPPKMMIVKYFGQPTSNEITALIGKGVTFDTGGYCLKTAAGMKMSKGDMGGAAAAIGAFEAAVGLKLAVNLLLVIPSTDNMISADGIKPGDVLQMMNGKTVEVTNTDAEGRLILADAITLAKELGASQIIDIATLTGAIVVALGDKTTGAFTNDQDFLTLLQEASKWTQEDIWPMPLYSRNQQALRSSLVADLNNCPTNQPGAIMAAAFLKEFVGDTPWIHLDIAGTADTNEKCELGPKGATGVMVRTLTKYLETKSSKNRLEAL